MTFWFYDKYITSSYINYLKHTHYVDEFLVCDNGTVPICTLHFQYLEGMGIKFLKLCSTDYLLKDIHWYARLRVEVSQYIILSKQKEHKFYILICQA